MNILKTLFPFIFGKPAVKQLTMEEILDETVNFYTSKNRGYDFGSCVYNGPNNTHCAVGRCLLPELQLLGDKLQGNTSNLNDLKSHNNVNSLDELLQPQYRGHKYIFWVKLQILHDISKNWCETGLSDEGNITVDEIKKYFKLNKN